MKIEHSHRDTFDPELESPFMNEMDWAEEDSGLPSGEVIQFETPFLEMEWEEEMIEDEWIEEQATTGDEWQEEMEEDFEEVDEFYEYEIEEENHVEGKGLEDRYEEEFEEEEEEFQDEEWEDRYDDKYEEEFYDAELVKEESNESGTMKLEDYGLLYEYQSDFKNYSDQEGTNEDQQLLEEGEVFLPDSRKLIQNTLRIPYRWICSLILYFKNPDNGGNEPAWIISNGTGTLIGPGLVLTAAHCFEQEIEGSKKTKKILKVEKIEVIPGRNEASNPFGKVGARDWKAAAGWRPNDIQNDFGLIKLRERIGEKKYVILNNQELGWWGKKTQSPKTFIKKLPIEFLQKQDLKVHSSGYPGDKCGKNPTKGSGPKSLLILCKNRTPDLFASTQWLSKGKLTGVNPHTYVIGHDIDAFKGQSGSPIWYSYVKGNITKKRWLVGMHTGSYPPDLNRAIFIQNVLKQLDGLRKGLGESEFDWYDQKTTPKPLGYVNNFNKRGSKSLSSYLLEQEIPAGLSGSNFVTKRKHHFVVLVSGYDYQNKYPNFDPLCRNRAIIVQKKVKNKALVNDEDIVFIWFSVAKGEVYVNFKKNGNWKLKKEEDWHVVDKVTFNGIVSHAASFDFEAIDSTKHYDRGDKVFKQDVENKVIGITDIYDFLEKLGAYNPGSLLEFSIISHGYWEGPILVNSYDKKNSSTDMRDPTDKDARHKKDFLPANMPSDKRTKIRLGFHSDGFCWMWGCNVFSAARDVIRGVAENNTVFGRRVKGIDGAIYKFDGSTPDNAKFRFSFGGKYAGTYSFFPPGNTPFVKEFHEIKSFVLEQTRDTYNSKIATAFGVPCIGPAVGTSSNYGIRDPYRPGTPVVHWIEKGKQWMNGTRLEKEANYKSIINFFVKTMGLKEDDEGRGYIIHPPNL